ncbi:uncharacterized protein NPIL_428381 [Nephila pilipes]|uniref:Uncharacterized protein n=1 Tax=Nephila pilipes TaxID=299642 RepID=A0A8X6J482_NEPPI|nr:uncharacterized protein NPIL_428381 [Nephila pilipes]
MTFSHLLDQLRHKTLVRERENLLHRYGKITKIMRKVDKELSLPVFVTITMSMVGLFWSGYRLSFQKHAINVYSSTHVSSVICYLTFQLILMISASMTNEMEKKVKSTVQCLKYKFPHYIRETKFTEVFTKENNLTLWKIYVLDRSLIVTGFGTLLTYGILIGTLGN